MFFLAYLLWIGFVLWTAPLAAPAYESFDLKSAAWVERATGAGSTIQYWGPAVPLLILGVFGAWWLLSGRALVVQSGAARWLGWIPGGRRLLRSLQAAMFADVLSLLVAAKAPLEESVSLAAEASGSWLIQGEAERLVARLRQGASLEECLSAAPVFRRCYAGWCKPASSKAPWTRPCAMRRRLIASAPANAPRPLGCCCRCC